MSEAPDGPLDGSGTRALIVCYHCASSATELVGLENPVLAGARIYRCRQCGYIDFVEQPSGESS